jgi:PAS domain S-box-containing protein
MSKPADLFGQKEKQLSDALDSVLRETAFDNRYSLHPRRLAELGSEIVRSLLQSMEDRSTVDAFGFGLRLAREGIGEKTILHVDTRIRRFVRDEPDGDRESRAAALDAVDTFMEDLLAGFMKAREDQILTDQEQLRRALATALESQSQELRIKNHAINTSINGITLADLEGNLTWVNSSFLQMWGFGTTQEVLGKYFGDFLIGEDIAAILRVLLKSGGWHGQLKARRHDGGMFNVELTASLIKNEEGRTFGIMTSAVDITEHLKAEEMEKELLLVKEIHHRIKNNLQVISSLLYLQSYYVEDAKTREMFKESQSRVRSMALLHEKLYQSKKLNGVNFSEYVKDLARNLFTLYEATGLQVNLTVNSTDIVLGMETAIPCGLIVNELVSNSLKHAFGPDKAGEVSIEIAPSVCPPVAREHIDGGKWYQLIISDNGKGFPADEDFRTTQSLGLKIVCNLTDQLGGIIELDRSNGTKFMVFFQEA